MVGKDSSMLEKGAKMRVWWILSLSFIIACATVPPEETKPPTPPTAPEEAAHPSKATLYFSFGYDYYQKKMYPDAVKNFAKAIEESTSYVSAYVMLARSYTNMGEFAKAESVYFALLEAVPGELKAYYGLGKLHTIMGDYERAIEYYNKATELNPSYGEAYYGLGYAYEKLGNTERALEYYQKTLECEPNLAGVKYRMAKIYEALSEYDKVVEMLASLVEEHPEDIDSRKLLADAYIELEQFDKALPHMQFLHERFTDNLEYCVKLARCYEGTANYEAARNLYLTAIEKDSTYTPAYYQLIRMDIKIKAFGEAERYIGIAKAHGIKTPIIFALEGDLFRERGDSAYKQKRLREALDLYRRSRSIFTNVVNMGDPDWAEYARKNIDVLNKKIKRTEDEIWWEQ